MRRLKRLAVVLIVGIIGLFGLPAVSHAAKPCNQYPTVIQPITCKILEKLP